MTTEPIRCEDREHVRYGRTIGLCRAGEQDVGPTIVNAGVHAAQLWLPLGCPADRSCTGRDEQHPQMFRWSHHRVRWSIPCNWSSAGPARFKWRAIRRLRPLAIS